MNREFNLSIIPDPEQPTAQAPRNKTGHMSFRFSYELIDKIRDYAYWERLTQQQVVVKALELFLKEKSIKSRPEEVKNSPKRGRKQKAL